MKKNALLMLAPLLLCALGAHAASKKIAPEAKVSVSARVGKTAVWVGDMLPYTIRAIHDRDVEFALDHLKKESLALAPFVVREISVEHGEWSPDKKLLEITLQLTTYEIGKSDLTIPPIPLYYFIREAGLGRKESQAETIQVPATRVGLRSTLTGGPLRPRDFKPIHPVDFTQIAAFLFLGLVGLSVVGIRGAKWAWKSAHRPKAKRRHFPRHARERLAHEGLAKIRAIGCGSDEESARFYHEVSSLVRGYLQHSLDLEASCLTPGEIERALQHAGTNGTLAHEIRDLLERCEAMKYSRDGLSGARERHGEALETLEKVVAAMRRELAR
ncbi:MAG: hypothetical protein HYV04_05140 [Deltaproteobacteria bacterium]|nr:hypothetical protein [Deltaproteobacteria bacterium]